MKNLVFTNYLYQYACENWEVQKNAILGWIKTAKFSKDEQQCFYSDRNDADKNYKDEIFNLFNQELERFQNEVGRPIQINDSWLVKYTKGDWHPPHTHGSKGYSGIVFVEFDEVEHKPPFFIDPQNDHYTDRTNYIIPTTFEGDMVIARSNLLHFTYPNNSDRERIILGFDMDLV